MDEFTERYLILLDLEINSESVFYSNGFSDPKTTDQKLVIFKVEAGVLHIKSIEKEIEIFIELNDYDYVDPDDKTLSRVMMSFMDQFINDYTVIENTHTSEQNTLHKNGYRYNNERTQSKLSYSFSGIQPSREEVERQVLAFIQIKNLSPKI